MLRTTRRIPPTSSMERSARAATPTGVAPMCETRRWSRVTGPSTERPSYPARRLRVTFEVVKIALTHNLRLSDSEEEAEFDSKETIEAVAQALQNAGHTVERVEVSGPATHVLSRLEAAEPDLVFNTAEGRK